MPGVPLRDYGNADPIKASASHVGAPRGSARILSALPNKEANVFVAGIDAHTRYVKVVVVERTGARVVLGPARVKMEESARLVALLAPYRPS